ncbi:MAG: type II and III secretion system protein, partial [Elusimicrobiota bacterium]|nr:type II and III secretion system protein [Elusimicrobiota bacterium]
AGVNALKTKDNVKLLANPKLVTKSGAVARFMVGGEFPVVSHSISGDNVEWKEYGIMMDITPIVLHDDIIDIKIDTELSRIDPATSKGDYWSLAKRKATSHLEMQSEETMVLAGLIETQTSKTKTGIPILCDIPILGAFFGKTVNIETKTNVLIFITPRIID